MRYCLVASLFSCFFLGCGSGSGGVPTDPSQLKPLTEQEQAEIKKQDDAVAAEEGQSVVFKKKSK